MKFRSFRRRAVLGGGSEANIFEPIFFQPEDEITITVVGNCHFHQKSNFYYNSNFVITRKIDLSDKWHTSFTFQPTKPK